MIIPILNFNTIKPCFSKATKRNINFCSKQEQDIFEKPKLKRGQFFDSTGNVFNRHVTYMFRGDMNWDAYARYLDMRFKNEPSVNTYLYACSDGREALSLKSCLRDQGVDLKKFFPIMAKDIEESIIQKALEYEAIAPEPSGIQYECANILDDIENIDVSKPDIIMCRNMWPYVDENEYSNFAKRLYEKLPKGSIVVLGQFDFKYKYKNLSFPVILLKNGFEHTLNTFYGAAAIFEKN